jgi:hypothetical protein
MDASFSYYFIIITAEINGDSVAKHQRKWLFIYAAKIFMYTEKENDGFKVSLCTKDLNIHTPEKMYK